MAVERDEQEKINRFMAQAIDAAQGRATNTWIHPLAQTAELAAWGSCVAETKVQQAGEEGR
jgi:hypothetical protein